MLYWIENQNEDVYAFEDISFLGYDRSFICLHCNRPVVFPKYSADKPHLLIEGAGDYPDYLQFTGVGRQMYLVSERTLELYEKNHISGYSDYYQVSITSEEQGPLKTAIPRYYSLNITGSVDLDLHAMRLKKKKVCSQCGQFEWNRMRMEPMILELSTWDRSDLCALRTFPGFKLCSPKARELMINNHLKGFNFKLAKTGDGSVS